MKAEIKFHDGIGPLLEVTGESDVEKYALMKLFEDRQPNYILIK